MVLEWFYFPIYRKYMYDVCVNEYMSIEQGCYKAVMDLIDDNKPMAVGILVGIFLFQVQYINHGLNNN